MVTKEENDIIRISGLEEILWDTGAEGNINPDTLKSESPETSIELTTSRFR